jgi:hypothetical protein
MTFIADEPIMDKPTTATPLYALPKIGDYITLADVSAIEVSEIAHYPPYVIVVVRRPNVARHYNICCDSLEEAREIRDQIAAARNQLK